MSAAAQKVVVITGAGGGIGRASCLAFAGAGYAVVGGDLDADAAKETAELCGDGAVGLRADVTSDQDVRDLIGTARSLHGRLDAAVNNAGIAPAKKAFTDVSQDEYDLVMAVNLGGVWRCMKEEIPLLLESGGGAIVNISSRTGHMGSPGRAPYSASKHGVIGLSRSAALEYGAHGLRINTICPGAIQTGIVAGAVPDTPDRDAILGGSSALARVGEPEEIAAAVLWLCSSGASYVNGTELAIDGGLARAYSGNRTS
jgi:NAD(P)-dependent dehydrogenase (short-subunit alcohol dehydrogenase family)